MSINGTRFASAVVLLPGLLLARRCASGPSTGSIAVTVLDGVTSAPVASAPVTLAATGAILYTGAAGKVEFAQVAEGPTAVKIGVGSLCPTARSVTVVAGRTRDVTIWRCSDIVEAQNAPDEAMIAMLDVETRTIGGGTACINDALLQGTGAATLGVNAVKFRSCAGGVAIFTADHAIAFSDVIAAMPWTDARNDVHSVILPPTPLRVPAAMIIATEADADPGETRLGAETQLTTAQAGLQSNLTGLVLAGSESGGPIPFLYANRAQRALLRHGCSAVARIRQQPSIYARGRLNVFVVDETYVGATPAQGVSCAPELAPEILFIVVEGSYHRTLLHEVGHALGLLRPAFGHTDALSGFYSERTASPANEMLTGGVLAESVYFSVGQVMRMTFAEESWVNLPSAADGSTLRQRQMPGSPTGSMVCGCPETIATSGCPALNRDVVRSATPPSAGNGATIACGVSAISVARLLCNVPTLTAATFSPAGAAGAARWLSLDLPIVTIAPGPTTTMTAVLTGHANGIATIIVNASGSPQRFQVEVAECP